MQDKTAQLQTSMHKELQVFALARKCCSYSKSSAAIIIQLILLRQVNMYTFTRICGIMIIELILMIFQG